MSVRVLMRPALPGLILGTVMVMESNYLVPDGMFQFWLALYAVVLVIGPAIDAGGQRRWGWVAAIVLLSPIAGLLWYVFRWSGAKRQPA